MVSIGDYTFYGCSNLTTVTFKENSQLTSIGSSAFEGCGNLDSITIPASVTSIGNRAFCACTNLTTVTFEENSRQFMSIGDSTFWGCAKLSSIIIPVGVKSICDDAFLNCEALTTIYYGGTKTNWTEISISSNGNDVLDDATYYYYSATKPMEEGNYWRYNGFKISCESANMIDSAHFKVSSDGKIAATAGTIGG